MTDTPEVSKSATALTIGCKLPNGLICELGKFGEENYRRHEIVGANDARVIGGYGLTENVPADFWNAWVAKHKNAPYMKKGLVFAVGDTASAVDLAKDFAEKKTGMERLDPYKDVARITKGEAEADLAHLKQGIKEGAKRGMAG